MTQKEKPKGKSNPFASYIRPTEEILWQSKEQFSMREVIPINTILALGVVFILFIVIAFAVVQDNPQMNGSEVITVTGLVFFGIGLRIFMRRSTRRMAGNAFAASMPTLGDHADYALTSERLFYQRGDDIRALSLDEVSVINILPDAKTISFGAVFPMWTGLEEAEQVKSLIETAQKEHLKATKA